jgi:hypothetical protein
MKNVPINKLSRFCQAVDTDFMEYEQYKKDVFPKSNERYFVAKPISQDGLVRKVNEMLTNNTNTHYVDT